jgi:hypothetical protein
MTPKSIALLLTPVGLIFIGAARLFIISDYNTTTAVTIASSGGYVSTLLGSVIPLVPVFMPYAALFLLLFKKFLLSIIAFVFAVFITPTPLTLPAAIPVIKAEEQRMVSGISGDPVGPAVIAFVILIILAAYTDDVVETLSGFVIVFTAFALLYIAWNVHLSTPISLSVAGNGERQVLAFASEHVPILIGIALLFLIVIYRNLVAAMAGGIVVCAVIVLFPYIYNIFPVPRHQNYYAQVLHELWLPPERIVLKSHQTYFGYLLSADIDWSTVLLLNSRTIVYLNTEDIVGRAVCQAGQEDQPYPYPPLIRIFYTVPPRIPSCATGISSIRSRGESLNEISAAAHVSPRQMLSTTNAHQHQRLSSDLRAYEKRADWNAPTPVGQHFWYYPPSTS